MSVIYNQKQKTNRLHEDRIFVQSLWYHYINADEN